MPTFFINEDKSRWQTQHCYPPTTSWTCATTSHVPHTQLYTIPLHMYNLKFVTLTLCIILLSYELVDLPLSYSMHCKPMCYIRNWIDISTSKSFQLKLYVFDRIKMPFPNTHDRGWGETTCTLVPWRQGFKHPTRNECMGSFVQIHHGGIVQWKHAPLHVCC